MTVTYSWSLGPELHILRDAGLVAFLDGRQLRLVGADGGSAWYLPIHIDAGEIGEVAATVADDLVSTGAHTMVVAAISARSGDVVTGQVWTVIRGATDFSEQADQSGSPVIGSHKSYTTVFSDGQHVPVDGPIPTVDMDGLLPLEFTLQTAAGSSCPKNRLPVVGIVLVDFQQVDLDSYGPFVRVALDSSESAFVETSIHGPAPDGSRHVVTLLQYSGDGWYSEAPPGKPTPWGNDNQPFALGFGFY